MRITTGKYKNRNIAMPAGIRPTQGLVRKAVFDIVGNVQGLFFLDLFAGSGAVGIEAASRGAEEVVLVENNPAVIRALKENASCMLDTKYLVLPVDAGEAIKRFFKDGRRFDIVFLDPPYCRDMLKKTLQTIDAYDILTPIGLAIVQHSRRETLPENLGVLSLLRQKKYADTFLSIYSK